MSVGNAGDCRESVTGRGESRLDVQECTGQRRSALRATWAFEATGARYTDWSWMPGVDMGKSYFGHRHNASCS